ncbi:hypothetical protein PIB30_025829, partial [Stylosanthes scabra]|nr:hypothetical protein [Stylosanthes scabra]
MRDLVKRDLEKKRENEVRMREKKGSVRFKVADAIARARHANGGPKSTLQWARAGAPSEGRGCAVFPGANPRAPSARVRTHQGRRGAAVRTRQEGSVSAPCNLVASAECGQAHHVGAPRPSCGRARRAGAPLEGRRRAVAPRIKNLEFSDRATAPPGGCGRANAL